MRKYASARGSLKAKVCAGAFDQRQLTCGSSLLSARQKSQTGGHVTEVTESELHRSMKRMVRRQLEVENYRVVEEPLCPPTTWLHWESYRPDLLGYRWDDASEQVVIAECETRPSTKKLLSKNYRNLWFEPSVFREGSVKRILAVPSGRLSSLDMGLRRQWEIWVLGAKAPMVKISSV